MPDAETLTAEIAELHTDDQDAARVARLCRVAAGQQCQALRAAMTYRHRVTWTRSPNCPLSIRLVATYLEAADDGLE